MSLWFRENEERGHLLSLLLCDICYRFCYVSPVVSADETPRLCMGSRFYGLGQRRRECRYSLRGVPPGVLIPAVLLSVSWVTAWAMGARPCGYREWHLADRQGRNGRLRH